MNKFFLSCDDCDPGYINIRDQDYRLEDKKFVEQLWSSYKPYADLNFKTDARKHFQERFWEMYLGNTFLNHKFELDQYSQKGPEFYLGINDNRYWIEAISPGAGEGLDAVPEIEYGKPLATRVPEYEIILRFRHAIFEKYKKYLDYVEQDIIKNNEPYVIAINSKRIRPILSDPEPPFIIKAVYPFGDLAAVFDTISNGIVDTYHEHRDSIEKKSGENISTDIFLNTEHSGISAVIYSSVDAVNYPNKFGSDFWLVHNKMAENPIPIGTFKFGVECWVKDDELKIKRWN